MHLNFFFFTQRLRPENRLHTDGGRVGVWYLLAVTAQTHITGTVQCYAVPVNMPDQIWKCFGYGQCSVRIGLDQLCQTRLPASNLVPLFHRKPGPYCAKLAWIQSGWPVYILARCIWSGSKPVCKSHQAWFWQNATGMLPVSPLSDSSCTLPQMAPVLAEHNRHATSFPFSDSVALFHRQLRSYGAKCNFTTFRPGCVLPQTAQITLCKM